jgi:hypothetical protein
MEKLYLFVLDFSTGRVHRYNIGKGVGLMKKTDGFKTEIYNWIEDFIIGKGHSLNNCEWMTTDNPELEY